MEASLEFELVTPERLLMAGKTEMVVIPGFDGDFGVLPGHAPLISIVRPGLVNIYEKGLVKQSFFVSGGFAEVSNNRCALLAEQAVGLKDIDAKETAARLDREREALEAAEPGSGEAELIAAKIHIIEAMLAVVKNAGAPGQAPGR